MRMDRQIVWIYLLAIFQFSDYASGRGFIETNFKNFENYEAKRLDGKCCQQKDFWSWARPRTREGCSDDCDHSFIICIGNATHSSSMSACEYGQKDIESVGGNKISFNSHVGEETNPVRFPFHQWPGEVKLKIDVMDEDEEFTLVDHYEYQYNTRDLRRKLDSPTQELTLSGRNTRLDVNLRVFCDVNYFGTDCSTYCTETDDETGHYNCDPSTGEKICKPGWTGADCLSDIDDCIGNRCYFGSTCVDGLNFYECACPPGKTGAMCEAEVNECASQPCENGGHCLDAFNAFICDCEPGYTGLYCEVEVDECFSYPCRNGGTCEDDIGTFSCLCPAGFTGQTCEVDEDECALNPCIHASKCYNTPGTYVCECFSGYTGRNCEADVNECDSGPCENGGSCINMVNGYTCRCPAGFEGTNCEKGVDHCSPNYCRNGATCNSGERTFTCECPPEFTGTLCFDDVDECQTGSFNCTSHGECINTYGGYECECTDGYEGNNCELETDECLLETAPCDNGGICIDGIGGYKCECLAGFTGSRCEINTDECDSSPCLNNGTCVDELDGFICLCDVGYTGTQCENPDMLKEQLAITSSTSTSVIKMDSYTSTLKTESLTSTASAATDMDTSGSTSTLNFTQKTTATSNVSMDLPTTAPSSRQPISKMGYTTTVMKRTLSVKRTTTSTPLIFEILNKTLDKFDIDDTFYDIFLKTDLRTSPAADNINLTSTKHPDYYTTDNITDILTINISSKPEYEAYNEETDFNMTDEEFFQTSGDVYYDYNIFLGGLYSSKDDEQMSDKPGQPGKQKNISTEYVGSGDWDNTVSGEMDNDILSGSSGEEGSKSVSVESLAEESGELSGSASESGEAYAERFIPESSGDENFEIVSGDEFDTSLENILSKHKMVDSSGFFELKNEESGILGEGHKLTEESSGDWHVLVDRDYSGNNVEIISGEAEDIVGSGESGFINSNLTVDFGLSSWHSKQESESGYTQDTVETGFDSGGQITEGLSGESSGEIDEKDMTYAYLYPVIDTVNMIDGSDASGEFIQVSHDENRKYVPDVSISNDRLLNSGDDYIYSPSFEMSGDLSGETSVEGQLLKTDIDKVDFLAPDVDQTKSKLDLEGSGIEKNILESGESWDEYLITESESESGVSDVIGDQQEGAASEKDVDKSSVHSTDQTFTDIMSGELNDTASGETIYVTYFESDDDYIYSPSLDMSGVLSGDFSGEKDVEKQLYEAYTDNNGLELGSSGIETISGSGESWDENLVTESTAESAASGAVLEQHEGVASGISDIDKYSADQTLTDSMSGDLDELTSDGTIYVTYFESGKVASEQGQNMRENLSYKSSGESIFPSQKIKGHSTEHMKVSLDMAREYSGDFSSGLVEDMEKAYVTYVRTTESYNSVQLDTMPSTESSEEIQTHYMVATNKRTEEDDTTSIFLLEQQSGESDDSKGFSKSVDFSGGGADLFESSGLGEIELENKDAIFGGVDKASEIDKVNDSVSSLDDELDGEYIIVTPNDMKDKLKLMDKGSESSSGLRNELVLSASNDSNEESVEISGEITENKIGVLNENNFNLIGKNSGTDSIDSDSPIFEDGDKGSGSIETGSGDLFSESIFHQLKGENKTLPSFAQVSSTDTPTTDSETFNLFSSVVAQDDSTRKSRATSPTTTSFSVKPENSRNNLTWFTRKPPSSFFNYTSTILRNSSSTKAVNHTIKLSFVEQQKRTLDDYRYKLTSPTTIYPKNATVAITTSNAKQQTEVFSGINPEIKAVNAGQTRTMLSTTEVNESERTSIPDRVESSVEVFTLKTTNPPIQETFQPTPSRKTLRNKCLFRNPSQIARCFPKFRIPVRRPLFRTTKTPPVTSANTISSKESTMVIGTLSSRPKTTPATSKLYTQSITPLTKIPEERPRPIGADRYFTTTEEKRSTYEIPTQSPSKDFAKITLKGLNISASHSISSLPTFTTHYRISTTQKQSILAIGEAHKDIDTSSTSTFFSFKDSSTTHISPTVMPVHQTVSSTIASSFSSVITRGRMSELLSSSLFSDTTQNTMTADAPQIPRNSTISDDFLPQTSTVIYTDHLGPGILSSQVVLPSAKMTDNFSDYDINSINVSETQQPEIANVTTEFNTSSSFHPSILPSRPQIPVTRVSSLKDAATTQPTDHLTSSIFDKVDEPSIPFSTLTALFESAVPSELFELPPVMPVHQTFSSAIASSFSSAITRGRMSELLPSSLFSDTSQISKAADAPQIPRNSTISDDFLPQTSTVIYTDHLGPGILSSQVVLPSAKMTDSFSDYDINSINVSETQQPEVANFTTEFNTSSSFHPLILPSRPQIPVTRVSSLKDAATTQPTDHLTSSIFDKVDEPSIPFSTLTALFESAVPSELFELSPVMPVHQTFSSAIASSFSSAITRGRMSELLPSSLFSDTSQNSKAADAPQIPRNSTSPDDFLPQTSQFMYTDHLGPGIISSQLVLPSAKMTHNFSNIYSINVSETQKPEDANFTTEFYTSSSFHISILPSSPQTQVTSVSSLKDAATTETTYYLTSSISDKVDESSIPFSTLNALFESAVRSELFKLPPPPPPMIIPLPRNVELSHRSLSRKPISNKDTKIYSSLLLNEINKSQISAITSAETDSSQYSSASMTFSPPLPQSETTAYMPDISYSFTELPHAITSDLGIANSQPALGGSLVDISLYTGIHSSVDEKSMRYSLEFDMATSRQSETKSSTTITSTYFINLSPSISTESPIMLSSVAPKLIGQQDTKIKEFIRPSIDENPVYKDVNQMAAIVSPTSIQGATSLLFDRKDLNLSDSSTILKPVDKSSIHTSLSSGPITRPRYDMKDEYSQDLDEDFSMIQEREGVSHSLTDLARKSMFVVDIKPSSTTDFIQTSKAFETYATISQTSFLPRNSLRESSVLNLRSLSDLSTLEYQSHITASFSLTMSTITAQSFLEESDRLPSNVTSLPSIVQNKDFINVQMSSINMSSFVENISENKMVPDSQVISRATKATQKVTPATHVYFNFFTRILLPFKQKNTPISKINPVLDSITTTTNTTDIYSPETEKLHTTWTFEQEPQINYTLVDSLKYTENASYTIKEKTIKSTRMTPDATYSRGMVSLLTTTSTYSTSSPQTFQSNYSTSSSQTTQSNYNKIGPQTTPSNYSTSSPTITLSNNSTISPQTTLSDYSTSIRQTTTLSNYSISSPQTTVLNYSKSSQHTTLLNYSTSSPHTTQPTSRISPPTPQSNNTTISLQTTLLNYSTSSPQKTQSNYSTSGPQKTQSNYSISSPQTTLLNYGISSQHTTLSNYSTSSPHTTQPTSRISPSTPQSNNTTISLKTTLLNYSTSSPQKSQSNYSTSSPQKTQSNYSISSLQKTQPNYDIISSQTTPSNYSISSPKTNHSTYNTSTSSQLTTQSNYNMSSPQTTQLNYSTRSPQTNQTNYRTSSLQTTLSNYSTTTASPQITYTNYSTSSPGTTLSNYSTSSPVTTQLNHSTDSAQTTLSKYSTTASPQTTLSKYSTSSSQSTQSNYSTSSLQTTALNYNPNIPQKTQSNYSTSGPPTTLSDYSTSSPLIAQSNYSTTSPVTNQLNYSTNSPGTTQSNYSKSKAQTTQLNYKTSSLQKTHPNYRTSSSLPTQFNYSTSSQQTTQSNYSTSSPQPKQTNYNTNSPQTSLSIDSTSSLQTTHLNHSTNSLQTTRSTYSTTTVSPHTPKLTYSTSKPEVTQSTYRTTKSSPRTTKSTYSTRSPVTTQSTYSTTVTKPQATHSTYSTSSPWPAQSPSSSTTSILLTTKSTSSTSSPQTTQSSYSTASPQKMQAFYSTSTSKTTQSNYSTTSTSPETSLSTDSTSSPQTSESTDSTSSLHTKQLPDSTTISSPKTTRPTYGTTTTRPQTKVYFYFFTRTLKPKSVTKSSTTPTFKDVSMTEAEKIQARTTLLISSGQTTTTKTSANFVRDTNSTHQQFPFTHKMHYNTTVRLANKTKITPETVQIYGANESTATPTTSRYHFLPGKNQRLPGMLNNTVGTPTMQSTLKSTASSEVQLIKNTTVPFDSTGMTESRQKTRSGYSTVTPSMTTWTDRYSDIFHYKSSRKTYVTSTTSEPVFSEMVQTDSTVKYHGIPSTSQNDSFSGNTQKQPVLLNETFHMTTKPSTTNLEVSSHAQPLDNTIAPFNGTDKRDRLRETSPALSGVTPSMIMWTERYHDILDINKAAGMDSIGETSQKTFTAPTQAFHLEGISVQTRQEPQHNESLQSLELININTTRYNTSQTLPTSTSVDLSSHLSTSMPEVVQEIELLPKDATTTTFYQTLKPISESFGAWQDVFVELLTTESTPIVTQGVETPNFKTAILKSHETSEPHIVSSTISDSISKHEETSASPKETTKPVTSIIELLSRITTTYIHKPQKQDTTVLTDRATKQTTPSTLDNSSSEKRLMSSKRTTSTVPTPTAYTKTPFDINVSYGYLDTRVTTEPKTRTQGVRLRAYSQRHVTRLPTGTFTTLMTTPVPTAPKVIQATVKRSSIRHIVDLTSNNTYPDPRKEIYEYIQNRQLTKGPAKLTLKQITVTVIRGAESLAEQGKKVVLRTYQRVKNISTSVTVTVYKRSRQLFKTALERVEALWKYCESGINHYIVRPLINARTFIKEKFESAYARLSETFTRGKLIFESTVGNVGKEAENYFKSLANYYTDVYKQYSTEVRDIFESLKIPDS